MSTATTNIPVTFAGIGRRGIVPAWARDFDASRSTVADLCRVPNLPKLSVVQSSRPKKILDSIDLLTHLFECLVNAPDHSSRIVLGFQKADDREILELAPLLGRIPGLAGRIELALRSDDLHDTILEAFTKVLATRSEQDPLGKFKTIAESGRVLCAPSGRLDAKKVAEVFGIPLAELARQIDASKQRISKTPDSAALQMSLRPYERIARLRTAFSDADFKAWLHTPNEHLEDDDPPIAYLKEGAREALAAFAENMLTGAPS